VSQTGKVPVLEVMGTHGESYQVHDSLAICETICDLYPDHHLHPADTQLRALARSACAEMHTGFVKLRNFASMNITRVLTDAETALFPYAEVLPEVHRLIAVWQQLLQHPRRIETAQSAWLLGEFGIVDAFFAPVITRINSYRITDHICLPDDVATYMHFALSSTGYQRWFAEARAELASGTMNYPTTDRLYRVA
jgi:glutathione S-transferase